MPYTEYISVSDLKIQLDVLFETTLLAIKEYRIPASDSADLRISISAEDILKEKEIAIAFEERCTEEPLPDRSTDESCEISVVLRKISEELPAFDALTFHGCAVAVDDTAYMFAAKSGTGKSTHAALWRQLLGEKAVVINGDKPFLRLIDETVYVYGSPWCGKEGHHSNCRKPLKAICFIEQSEKNSITEVDVDEVSGMLIQQCHRPCNQEKLIKTIQLLNRMSRHIRFYKMKCNMDISAAEMSYRIMKN